MQNMNLFFKLLFLTVIGIPHPFLWSSADHPVKTSSMNRIGIIGLFPDRSGLFFDDRMYFPTNSMKLFAMKHKSRFPEKGAIFHTNLNQLMADILVESLETQFKEHDKLMALPPLSTAEHVTGYMIERHWGQETKSVHVKGLEKMFQDHNLDKIIAIVPVTYQGSGIEVRLSNTALCLSCCYCVIVFVKKGKTYEKEYSSIKQVYRFSKPLNKKKKLGKHYNQELIDEYYLILKEHFVPHIAKQLSDFLNHKNPSTVFLKPKEPLKHHMLDWLSVVSR